MRDSPSRCPGSSSALATSRSAYGATALATSYEPIRQASNPSRSSCPMQAGGGESVSQPRLRSAMSSTESPALSSGPTPRHDPP